MSQDKPEIDAKKAPEAKASPEVETTPKEVKADKPEEEAASEDETQAAKPSKKFRRKKVKRSVAQGRVYIKTSFNNTIISVCDQSGNVLAATSSGACGFRGSKKGVAYAAGVAADKVAAIAQSQHGMKKVDIFVKGIGQGRDAAIRSLMTKQIQIESISDGTKTPHGGPRPRKARRV